MAQLYPQALGTYFSRILGYSWATVGLFFNLVTTRDTHVTVGYITCPGVIESIRFTLGMSYSFHYIGCSVVGGVCMLFSIIILRDRK